jgi:RNA polymerase sigma-19 factor, ECF subfamily
MTRATTHSLFEAAFAHRERLHQYLCRRLANEEDAHELAQEAFLRILRVTRADLIEDPQAYLYRIARNLVYERTFRALPAGSRADDAELDTLVDPQLTPEAAVEHAAFTERFERVIAELSPRNQAILLLFCKRGLNQREIAAQLGLSKSMVQKCLAQALAHCRKRLRALQDNGLRKGIRP